MVFVVFYVFFTLSKNCVTPEKFNGFKQIETTQL